MVQAKKRIALLHRYPKDRIKETNAAFYYLELKGIDVLTFKTFNRLSNWKKFLKSLLWIFYAPCLVIGKRYDVIYCDDSFPFYPALVKLVSPKSKVVIRIGDFHLMYYTSGWVYKLLHFFEKMTWKMVDEIVPISDEMAIFIWSEIIPKKITVVYDSVDPKDFEVNKTYHTKTVMFHGLITKNKNIDVLIQAAEELSEINFDIIGDGPDLKRLKEIAPENVFFYGWVPFNEIRDLLRCCGVGVALRSNNIGNQYVVTSPFLQYGVLGKPCLVTRRAVYGDYPWQFSSVDEMVKKLKILLDNPNEGEKLQKFVLENHDAKKIAEEIWDLLSA
jgi:glycosyltransferase involved in cell wall biosynthesis